MSTSLRMCVARVRAVLSRVRVTLALVLMIAVGSLSAQDELVQPREVVAVDSVLSDTLTLAISPLQLGDRTITSRLFNGGCPGPTWRLQPGDLLRVFLRNQLPPNPDQDSVDQGNYSQRLNTTNLHVHGLNVSPKDSSDNVLRSILPGEDFQFHIQLPDDHASGTYWYHPHHHTSTYGQIISGLAGTIVVEDVRDPSITDPALLAMDDRIFVFTSFVFDTTTNTLPYPHRLRSATALNPYDGIETPVYVNGMRNAKVTFRPGEIQRWRFVNATFELNIDLRWLRIDNGDTTAVEHQEISADGLYFERAVNTSQVLVVTGARSDVLVTAPAEAGRYILQLTTRGPQLDVQEIRELIAMVVEGDPISPPLSLPSRLPIAIARGMVHDSEITGFRHIVFDTGDFGAIKTDSSAMTRLFMIDSTPFDHDRINISVTSGDAEEWIIENASTDFHPFHIHVNEFQVLEKDGVPLVPPVWRDVLMLDTLSKYKIRHRFGEQDGKTVLHCHYVPHEDVGMMHIIDILPKSTSVQERPWESLLAFPNPIVGRIDRVSVRIPEFLAGRTVTITLHDIVGTQVATQIINASQFVGASPDRITSIDVSALSAGTYFIRVDGGGAYRETDMLVLVR